MPGSLPWPAIKRGPFTARPKPGQRCPAGASTSSTSQQGKPLNNNTSEPDEFRRLRDRVVELHADLIVTLDDVSRLQGETAATLADLRERVDRIDARLTALEAR